MRHRLGALAFALALGLGAAAPMARAEVLHLTPDEALMTARAAYLSGDVEAAAHIARALASVQPDDPLVHLLLSATEPKLGRAQAGLIAGRKAWKLAGRGKEARPLRYEIARNTAKAALDAGKPLQAQFWLRRSLDVAPDDAAFAASGRDLGLVRNRSPWRLAFDMEAGPSDNLNGGADSSVFRIGDFVLGELSNGSEALSGARANLRIKAERALPGSARAQTVLGLSAEVVRNQIDAASRDEAGTMTSRDLDRTRLSFGLRRDLLLGDRGMPLSLSVELGQNWAGGEVLGPSLGVTAQGAIWRGPAGTIWLGGGVERAWDDANIRGADLFSLSVVGERAFGKTEASVALTVEAARSEFINSTYDAARLSLQLSPDWKIGGASVSLGATAGLRDYEAFSLGLVHVTGGREDASVGLSMDLSFDDWSVMGFAPVLSLRHGKTKSNVSRYETGTSGISIGISSVF
ncbi:surface lipoprotein assembly modifier [Tabrizicola oligotrophica]|uniref:DUF560 domain-containing protein n=1 Tax=Tabrizicola oligotrophica TaxID=2710650 RepID=A0A6M0QY38_9RHOB|nr:surface lipoprotein assembly modifier [Tabrizicola oligotrophica]NEY91663.1 DUF560 domain-containing protein [Tabrizicola oligotrophica]